MVYSLMRKALFLLPEELAHRFALKSLRFMPQKPIPEISSTTCFGLHFKNKVGLAAGCDKNGDYLNQLGKLGFGFLEVGTVTPRGQSGNPKPRLFRIPEHQAILNRMGFNNLGVDHLVKQLKRRTYEGILGVNIGKNLNTPVNEAVDDYLYCLQKVYAYADYIVLNVSSPNTEGLRALQEQAELEKLLKPLKQKQDELARNQQRKVPLLVKISPDESSINIEEMVHSFERYEIDGIIATNTTVDKSSLIRSPYQNEAGGVSGLPVKEKSTKVIEYIRSISSLPVIGVGGISSQADAQEKYQAGANLIQVYTGLIYQGPKLVKMLIQGDGK